VERTNGPAIQTSCVCIAVLFSAGESVAVIVTVVSCDQ
jgi:hypothetical protein